MTPPSIHQALTTTRRCRAARGSLRRQSDSGAGLCGGPPFSVDCDPCHSRHGAFSPDTLFTVQGYHPVGVLSGAVTSQGGSVTISFHRPGDPTSAQTLYTFTSAANNIVGSFVLEIDDVTLAAGATSVPLTGTIRDIQFGPRPVPEPMTVILLGTGLAGVAAKVRRRKAAGI